MTDSFSDIFSLPLSSWEDSFHGDRNLNKISCVRSTREAAGRCSFRIFAAPSTQPELRRADNGDSLLFYLQEAALSPDESLLAITHNRHFNRQFVQLAYQLMKEACPLQLDVVGCVPDERIACSAQYDPFQFLQDLISQLDWIERFRRDLCPDVQRVGETI